MKDKSICAQVFDLLNKKIPLAKIIVIVDIDPDEAMKLEDKHLYVTKRGAIVNLLKDQQDMDLTIDRLEFLKANTNHFEEIKEIEDLEFSISNLKYERDEIIDEIKVNKKIKDFNEKMEKRLGTYPY